MTITAIKKENFKRTIELLINKYKAYDIDNEGAHIHMLIDFENNTIPCELSRDCMFESWDILCNSICRGFCSWSLVVLVS